MAQEFDQAVIDHGVTITTSAGNLDQQPAHYPDGCGSPLHIDPLTLPPATAKNVIAVGGSENVRGGTWSCHNSLSTDFRNIMENSKRSTRYNGRASDSNKWYIKPDLFAPPLVWPSISRPSSPRRRPSVAGDAVPLGTGGLYIGGTGTSFAAPVAAGAAILASRRYAETAKMNGQPVPGAAKPSLVKAMLIAGAKSMYGGYDMLAIRLSIRCRIQSRASAASRSTRFSASIRRASTSTRPRVSRASVPHGRRPSRSTIRIYR